MIYTISQRKINTQCVSEYTKIIRELYLNPLTLKTGKGSEFNAQSKFATHQELQTEDKRHNFEMVGPLGFLEQKDSLSNLIAQTKLRQFLEKGLLYSSSKTATKLSKAQLEAAFPLILLPYYDIKAYKYSENLKNLRQVCLSANQKELDLNNYGKHGLINDIKQLKSPDFLWGTLLFARNDIAFINLRSILSSLMKALHVCLFAALNNKRIVFVGDPQPLVQEYQQRLLSSFIANQVNSFSTKMTQLLSPFLPTFSKNRISFLDNKKRFLKTTAREGLKQTLNITGNNTKKTNFKLCCGTTNLSSPDRLRQGAACGFKLVKPSYGKGNDDLKKKATLIKKQSVLFSFITKESFFTHLHVLLGKSKAFSSKDARLKNYDYNLLSSTSFTGTEQAKPASIGSKKSAAQISSLRISYDKDYSKSNVKNKSQSPRFVVEQQSLAARFALGEFSFFEKSYDKTFRNKANVDKFLLGKIRLKSKLTKKNAFKLLREPLNFHNYVLGEGFHLSKTSKKKGVINEVSELQKKLEFFYKKREIRQNELHLLIESDANFAVFKESQSKNLSSSSKELKASKGSYGKLHSSKATNFSSEENITLERKARSKDRNELSQSIFFHTGVFKLVGKAAIRSGQWTASLAQPTNFWIGGFFSNSMATYKQKLSSASLLNIKMDPNIHLQDVLKNDKPFLDFFPKPSKLISRLQPSVNKLSNETWTDLYAPVPKKTLVNSLEIAVDDFKQRKSLLKSFRGQFSVGKNPRKGSIYSRVFVKRAKNLKSKHTANLKFAHNAPLGLRLSKQNKGKKIKLLRSLEQTAKLNLTPLLTRSSKNFHEKVISHCINSIEMNAASNAWLKEADLVFFTNPEKTLSLLNQVNRLKIPTLGILSSGSNLAFPFRSVKGFKSLSYKPTINYPIIGNANSLSFLRLVLTKFACVLNKKRI